MPTLRSTTATLLYLSANLLTHAAASSEPMAHALLHKRIDYEGCYSSSTPLTYQDSYTFQSSGHCEAACKGISKVVAATTGGGDCWCGDEYPALADKVDLSKCNVGCQGYDSEMCGGDGFWTVYPALNNAQVSNYGGSSSSTSSSSTGTTAPPSSTTTPPTVITSAVSGGKTVLVTVAAPTSDATASSSSNNNGGGGSSNTAGIAAGVVVGVVAVAAIAAGLFFFMRHKKRKDAEADFKQRTQVSDFMRGANERKPPGTGYSGMSDQRLDPEAGRRNSVGSLADNQDYSRRILRVANPDSSQ